jgi:hypothetical protein
MRRAGWLALVAVALGGCDTPGYDHLQLSATIAVAGADLSSVSVTVPEGAVLEVAVTPMSIDGPLEGDFTFDLTSLDPDVLGVEPALGQAPGLANFVLFGAGPGETTVNVTVNGQLQTPLQATVTPQ